MDQTPKTQKVRSRGPAVVGAAAAVSAAILLPLPTAGAAPNCVDYIYPSSFEIMQDNNILTAINNNGNRFDGGGASYKQVGASGGDTRGISTGSRNGRNIDITVNWNNGFSSHITGFIADDLVARGTTVNNQGISNTWYSLNKFRCVAPPEAPKPPPPTPVVPPPVVAPPVQQQGTPATALADVDVYDQPGGLGTKRPGFVPEGSPVRLLERRDDNWCLIRGDAVPGGEGWAFGDFIG